MCGVITPSFVDNCVPLGPSPLMWESCKCGPCPLHNHIWTDTTIPNFIFDLPPKPKHRKPGPAQ